MKKQSQPVGKQIIFWLDMVLEEEIWKIWENGRNLGAQYVSPGLRDSAALMSRSMEQFDASVEYLLIKYGKDIIHQQFLLKRLADSAIDIYACMCVLSRATRSENLKLSTAEHEANMVKVMCNEAADNISSNLSSIRAQDKLKNFKLMKMISDQVCENGGVVQNHPLDQPALSKS